MKILFRSRVYHLLGNLFFEISESIWKFSCLLHERIGYDQQMALMNEHDKKENENA